MNLRESLFELSSALDMYRAATSIQQLLLDFWSDVKLD